MVEALGLYAAGSDANLFYATRFSTPDPYIFLQIGGRKLLVAGDLELGRAHEHAEVDEVLSATELEKQCGDKSPAAQMAHLLRSGGASELVVPENFWTAVADDLRERGIAVRTRRGSFWPQREIKSAEEIEWIRRSLAVTAEAIGVAERALAESTIQGQGLAYRGEPLTAERLRGLMNSFMAERGCSARDTIIAAGDQACDPHLSGSGPLPANLPIVIDVFPRSVETGYWGDMTRTFVKGRASAEARRLYEAVREGQALGMGLVRDGAEGTEIHKRIVAHFDSMGFKTERRGDKMVGFFHGTGHGLGLDIHEPPSIGKRGTTLRTGAVVTVEPGLYYFGVGGVRLEDVVAVESAGCRKISEAPYRFEIP
jgi:Xaa-Pro aminopeptidase